jgi:hypothetical protein
MGNCQERGMDIVVGVRIHRREGKRWEGQDTTGSPIKTKVYRVCAERHDEHGRIQAVMIQKMIRTIYV